MEAAKGTAVSKVQTLTSPESSLQGAIAQMTMVARDVGGQVGSVRQECDHEVEDIILERYGVPGPLNSRVSQLSGARQ